MENFEIYGLYDPRDGSLRYIGKAKNSKNRLKSHMRERKREIRKRYPVYIWMNKIVQLGMEPVMRVIETTNDWKSAERRLIEISRMRGDRLLNVADGGNEPFCSKEVRRANAFALNEKMKNDKNIYKLKEAKRTLTIALKKNQISNKTRAKLRLIAEKMPSMFGEWKNLHDRIE